MRTSRRFIIIAGIMGALLPTCMLAQAGDTVTTTVATTRAGTGTVQAPAPTQTDSAKRATTRDADPQTVTLPDGEEKSLLSKFTVVLDAAQIFQSLSQRNDAGTLPDLTPGFQAAVGNAHIYATIVPGLDMYAEFYLSSKHHAGFLMDREGYLLVDSLPEFANIFGINRLFRVIDVKAGHFEVDYGNQHLTRSDNAEVQRNPLIGNYVVDPNTVEAGVEVTAHLRALRVLGGVGNGGTVEDFQPGHKLSMHGKVWVEPKSKQYNVAASFYRVNQSANPTSANGGSFTEMFSGNRSGSRYSGVLGLTDPEAGQLKIGQGQNLEAWQLDGTTRGAGFTLSGLFGNANDMDINGSNPGTPDERWSYYGGEVKYDVLPIAYLVGRYSGAHTGMYKGTSANARVDRLQFGLGWWLASPILVKTEYVTQRYRGFSQDFVGDPRFHGLLLEASASVAF
ncbi:MAG TPA: hypothetical protein VFJ96_12850 [Gemmatimonadaceae bacterium]|nr:hypothetical protein [Gemmatimonadaceae bacterium]